MSIPILVLVISNSVLNIFLSLVCGLVAFSYIKAKSNNNKK